MSNDYPWRLVERTKEGQRTLGEYAVKRDLVEAMDAVRAPKAPVYFVGHRTYVITLPS